MLQFDPRSFTQQVRMHLRARPGVPVVVVEGDKDRRVLRHILRDDVEIIDSRGKPALLEAYDQLGETVNRLLCLVDCDDSLDRARLGKPGLVVSTFRDLDADLMLGTPTLMRILRELHMMTQEARIKTMRLDEVRLRCTGIAVQLSRVRAAAKSEGLAVRMRVGGRKRPWRLSDAPDPLSVLDSHDVIDNLVNLMAGPLSWGPSIRERVAELAKFESCGTEYCDHEVCLRRLVVGHDLIDIVATTHLSHMHLRAAEGEVERLMRVSFPVEVFSSPAVFKRVQKWEEATGLRVLDR